MFVYFDCRFLKSKCLYILIADSFDVRILRIQLKKKLQHIVTLNPCKFCSSS